MNDTRTTSMLQRVPVILAVTAAAYGLQVPQQVQRWTSSATAQRSTSSDPVRLPLLPLQDQAASRKR